MAPEKTGRSKWFWWFMEIGAVVIAGVISAVIIAKLNLGGQGAFNANSSTFDGEFNSEQGPWNIEMPCTFSNSGNAIGQYQIQAVEPNNSPPQKGSLSANKS